MESPERRRYDVVNCVVIGHARYGLLIESEDGECGFVDSSDITDTPGEPWPAVGEDLRCIVLGHAKDGRLRVAVTPAYVDVVAAADDPATAVDHWSSMTGRGQRRASSA